MIIEPLCRETADPLVNYIEVVQEQADGLTVRVALSEFLPAHWYELLLHNRTPSRVKLDRWPLRVVFVASVPYHLRQYGDGAGWAIESMTTEAEQQWTRRDSAAFR